MENILDLLYEYSKRKRSVDKEYIIKVIKIITKEKELKDYIKRTRFESISENNVDNNEACTPMAYNTYTQEVLIDMHNLDQYRDTMVGIFCNSRFSDFEQTLTSNSVVTQALLHETEHANQSKKSRIRNGEFENLLLGIACHADNEFSKESKLSKFLMLSRGIYLNTQLYHNLGLQQQLNAQFKTSTPIERMANIHSATCINDMLKQIGRSESIANVISLFESYLAGFQLNGYSYNDGTLISPTKRYLEEVKKLNFYGIDSHFNKGLETAMNDAEVSSLENRLLLGLDITEEEYQTTKMELTRKLN